MLLCVIQRASIVFAIIFYFLETKQKWKASKLLMAAVQKDHKYQSGLNA